MPTTQHFTKGTAIIYKDQPWMIISNLFVNPGKGAAFTKAKMRNLKTAQVLEVTFKSGESAELAEVARKKCQFLYADGNDYHFMDNENYDQFSLDKETIGEDTKFLIDDTECYALHIDGNPVSVQLPPKMTFEVIQAPPGVKGDTATGGSKDVTIETGATIKVPLFIDQGQKIIVNTETGDYVSKA